jgi:uncharacterized membrane protein YgcG
MQLSVSQALTPVEIKGLNEQIERIKESDIQVIIHIESLLEENIEDRAAYILEKLDTSVGANYILFVLSVATRKFALLTSDKISEEMTKAINEDFSKNTLPALRENKFFEAFTNLLKTIEDEIN